MRISQNLPQFERTPALIVVCGGKQEALMYKAQNGEIVKINEFRAFVREYADKEGAYRVGNARGQTFQAGSIINEHRKQEIIQKFLRQLEGKLKKRLTELKPKEIYLFAPKHIAEQVFELIPKARRDKLRLVINGNYETSHPFDLLKKIQDDTEPRTVTPHSAEAVKLLHRGEYSSNKRGR